VVPADRPRHGTDINVAAEKKGYTITDRATYLALKKGLGLDILVEGDASLLNIYHVMEVNPAKWPKVNHAGAKAFADFMVSKKAQDIVKTFGVKKFGAPLFFPDAGKKDEYHWLTRLFSAFSKSGIFHNSPHPPLTLRGGVLLLPFCRDGGTVTWQGTKNNGTLKNRINRDEQDIQDKFKIVFEVNAKSFHPVHPDYPC